MGQKNEWRGGEDKEITIDEKRGRNEAHLKVYTVSTFNVKNLSLCHKYKFYNLYIFAT